VSARNGTRLGVGVVGSGDVAPAYLKGILANAGLRLIGCAGRSVERTRAVAERFSTDAFSVAELLATPEVDVVLNLSAPQDHAAVTEAALRSGKHVYSEKPLAASEPEGDALIAIARDLRLHLACAPAPWLGPAQQTARSLIDLGAIGTVVGATTAMVYPGPDLFHHHPSALFAEGGGPLFDMGVYDVSALHHLLGPVDRVGAYGSRLHEERTIRHGVRAGDRFAVTVPTHVAAVLRFAAGPVATMTVSFDGFATRMSGLEIHGSCGTIRLPPSNTFDGPVLLSTTRDEWRPVEPVLTGWSEDLWIIGLLDLTDAIRRGTLPRCSAIVARHVMATLHAIDRSLGNGRQEVVGHGCSRMPTLPSDGYQRFRRSGTDCEVV
jgi:predicted dehydrogenase